jgi:hypothetical protein
MKLLRFAACMVVFMGVAQGRPVVLEGVATLPSPDPSWQYLGRFGMAIDGDFALVSAERYVPDPGEPGAVFHQAAVLLYQRSGSSWNYVGTLGGLGGSNSEFPPAAGLAMKDGVAMTIISSPRIFERVGSTWIEAPLSNSLPTLSGEDIEIDGGRILVSRNGFDTCNHQSAVLRKIGGEWRVEGEFVGTGNNCNRGPDIAYQDISGNRAIMYLPGDDQLSPHIRRFIYEDGSGWRQYGGNIFGGSIDSILGPAVALAGPYHANTGSRERGSSTGYPLELDGQELGAWSHYGMQSVDTYLQPDPRSTTVLERVGPLFAQRNYSHDRGAHVYNLFRMNEDPRASTLVATLQSKSGTALGEKFDATADWAIVNGWALSDRPGYLTGDNTVRVYQIPASLEAPAVQNHDFESASAGDAWQTSGGAFSFARVGHSRVYRQGSTAGNPSAWLPTTSATNQAIQAEVTIRALSGSNAWVGLATRRSDASNYYYLTLRNNGTLELKRMAGGVFTTLASAPAPVNVNRKYRLRLESIGTTHRVFRDDRLVLRVNDSTLVSGTAGIIMNNASADYDNVIVTPTPFTTIYTRNFSSTRPGNWYSWEGRWESVDGVFRQSYDGGYARTYVGADTDDQIVSVRVRPTSFVEPDNWVGVLLRDRGDGYNHAYVSLRGRGVISLWRRTAGAIQQLATRTIPVSTGTWYDLRVEVVAGLTRVFVNNQLMLSTSADLGPTTNEVRPVAMGQVGLVTHKATADFDDFRAYQP